MGWWGTGSGFGQEMEDRAVPGLRDRLGASLDVPSCVLVGPMGCVAIGRRNGVGIDG